MKSTQRTRVVMEVSFPWVQCLFKGIQTRQSHSSIVRLVQRLFFSFFILFLITDDTQAQFAKPQWWFSYNQTGRWADRWSYGFDINHRTNGLIPFNSSLTAARVGLNYHTNTGFRVTGGYAWFGTFAPQAKQIWLHEHRLYEQVQFNHTKGDINFVHRLRIEQRWRQQFTNEQLDVTLATFTNRYRYLFQVDGPITALPNQKTSFRWQLGNEFFIHNKEEVGYMLFDQNRTLAGVVISPTANSSVAILYQLIVQQQPFLRETFLIHSFRITLFQALDFRKLKKNQVPEIYVVD